MPEKRRKGVQIPPAEHARNKAYGRRYKENRQKVLGKGRVCAYRLPGCLGRATQTDHVVEVSRGGSSRPENLVPCCSRCNAKKREARKRGRSGVRVGKVETLVSRDDCPDYLRSDERFPAPGFGSSCPHKALDGSGDWCVGRVGHWSRWWFGKREDVDPPPRDPLVA
jgi:HNH endonuclease